MEIIPPLDVVPGSLPGGGLPKTGKNHTNNKITKRRSYL